MTRIIKVGGGGDEIGWHAALKDLRADDVLLLEPGFYDLPQGLTLADLTIKGMGSNPEDTTILGYLALASDCRFVNLENLCLNTISDHNSLFIPTEANTYLSLRNCVIKGFGNDTATIAANGKLTLELYSSRIIGGSVSLFQNANFHLEMNDSLIDYPSAEYCALALEGSGTAIINNSRIHGSTNTFAKSDVELDVNNSQLDYALLHGQTWLNLLNSKLSSPANYCLYLSDQCWSNIIHCQLAGGLYLDKSSRTILQNSHLQRLIAVDQSRLTMVNSQVLAHADFQNQVHADLTRVSFNGKEEYEYFLALSGKAQLTGHDLILHANQAALAVEDDAVLRTNVLASDQKRLKVECSKKPNIHILGMDWTAEKK